MVMMRFLVNREDQATTLLTVKHKIDIMGEVDKNTALFGECKWTNEKVDVSNNVRNLSQLSLICRITVANNRILWYNVKNIGKHRLEDQLCCQSQNIVHSYSVPEICG